MGKINILDLETSNKIAAGEVVERPASVVKELVENSLDAGAKDIIVEISEGGQKSIKVTDNGSGIFPEDVERAFLPHATSKIKNIEDIYSINTMGFRGEALPSVGSVSHVLLKSRVQDFSYGKEVSITGGTVDYVKEAASNVGTVVEVEDIFYNIPARQKFLKSSQSESAAISDILTRLALANPEVAFKLYNNSRKVINTYGSGNLTDTIRCIYGKNICDNILSFEGHSDKASVYGYIGNADISRGSRNNQSVFVNKRYIKSKLITAAVENAYKSFLTINKFPFFILFIDIYPEFIDVNVHPTKSEIKFREDREIFKLVFDAVHSSLRKNLMDSFNEYEYEKSKNIILENADKKNIDNIYERGKNSEQLNVFNEEKGVNDQSYVSSNSTINLPPDLKTSTNITRNDYKNEEIVNNKSYENKVAKFPQLTIVGQFHSTYIIAEDSDGLYIVDQHAAHEKILFEKFKNDISKGQVISQVLIAPAVLELHPDDFAIYTDNAQVFSRAGFSIEVFGQNTINIKEVPLLLGKPDIDSLFIDILDNLKNMGSGETVMVKYSKIAKAACRSAVKANDRLSIEEMESLLNDLRFIEDPFTCPHGRPTIIKFTLNELEKKFKRIQ